MQYIVLDLEWNQSPFGKEDELKNMPFEIIEIGAVKLDENLNEVDTFHELIKPKVYKDLHYKTKQIVNLTMEELEKGKPFTEVMKAFLAWCGEEYIFCTWGVMDLSELQRNMEFYGMGEVYTTPLKYYDIQKFFSLLHEDGKVRRTLHHVIEYLQLKEELRFHSALNDAIYTAQVIKHIDFEHIKKNYSIDCYHIPATRKDEIHAVFDTYEKYISRGFKTRDDMMKDKEVLALTCYQCNKNCHKKIRWYSTNNAKTYYALGICKEHGYLKGKIRAKQAENGLYYAIKTTKLVDEDGAQKVRDRQIQLRAKRRERRKRIAEEKRLNNAIKTQ